VTDVAGQKVELRTKFRAIRAAMGPDRRLALGRVVHERLFALQVFADARTLLLFYSFGSEIPTAGIIQRSLDEGRRVFLPLLEGGEMLASELRPGDSLAATTYGPKEPSTRVPVDPAEVDLVIAPGLGFDRLGHRLGYGGGHYDRYLPKLRPETPRLGIAFHQQLVAELPHDPGDERLDLVVTDREVAVCPTRPGGPQVVLVDPAR
jgi:5-formyltetrahydrofolate cyclo-ligase